MNSGGIQGTDFRTTFHHFRLQRGLAFGIIIIAALLAFEIFNFSTTDYALSDLLGDLSFLGVRWATILAIAFCGIDFAGIARLFTPEEGADEPAEVWYLFGAWLLAATMNAMLTWWGVSTAIVNHQALGSAVIERETLLRVVPIFVAVLVWLIRVLIIGTFSVAGERLFSQANQRMPFPVRSYRVPAAPMPAPPTPVRSLGSSSSRMPAPRAAASTRSITPAPKTTRSAHQVPQETSDTRQEQPSYHRPEPTYHPLSASPASPRTQVSNPGSGYSRSLNAGGMRRR
jgi:hypothetical protein